MKAAWLVGFLALLELASTESELEEESSDAYLRNVVNELQILNGISPTNSYVHREEITSTPVPAQLALDRFAAGVATKYDQPQVIPKKSIYVEDQHAEASNPVALGFTTAELATMYRKAIERGVPMKYNSLVNSVNSYQVPKVIGPQYEVADVNRPNPEESNYAYYFYPLQSFRHELTNNHGYRTVPDFKYDSMPAENSKKETSTMNPILVGISSFLATALLFMISMFVYPRFMHYMHFPFVTTSRMAIQNEIAHITAFVTEAIEYYNKNIRKNSKRSSTITPIR